MQCQTFLQMCFLRPQRITSNSTSKPRKNDSPRSNGPPPIRRFPKARRVADGCIQTPRSSYLNFSGQHIFSIGLDVANLHTSAECTPDTLYDIASSSKSLTAASVALLVEDDKNHPEVQWDTPLYDLLPEDFVMPTPELNERITIVDVLSHRTGMAL
jgi:CubicO group peptidase (beta-lactamase class C family)